MWTLRSSLCACVCVCLCVLTLIYAMRAAFRQSNIFFTESFCPQNALMSCSVSCHFLDCPRILFKNQVQPICGWNAGRMISWSQ